VLGCVCVISQASRALVINLSSATFKELHTGLSFESTYEKTRSVVQERLEASLDAGIPDASSIRCGDEMATKCHRPRPSTPGYLLEVPAGRTLSDALIPDLLT
jgi:hypothetical protein